MSSQKQSDTIRREVPSYNPDNQDKQASNINGWKYAQIRIAETHSREEQLAPGDFQLTSIPSAMSELQILQTPTHKNYRPSEQYYTESHFINTQEQIVKLHSQNFGALNGVKQQIWERHSPHVFLNNNIRAARVAIPDQYEPSIQQAIKKSHLFEINCLLRSQNSSLQQNNNLLTMMLKERDRQLADAGFYPQLRAELQEMRALVQRMTNEKIQNSNSNSISDVSIMNHNIENLHGQLQAVTQRLRDIQREAIVLRQCLHQEKNLNHKLNQQITQLERRIKQYQSAPKQPSLFNKGRRSYSFSSHHNSDGQESKHQMSTKDSEKILIYYGRELSRLTSQNDRLTLECATLNKINYETKLTIGRLQEQKGFLNNQIEFLQAEVNSVKQVYQKELHISQSASDKKTQLVNQQIDRLKKLTIKLEGELKQANSQLEKRDASIQHYMHFAEQFHMVKWRSIDLQNELHRLKTEHQRLMEQQQVMSLHLTGSQATSNNVVQELWRQKNNEYVMLTQQLNNFRKLIKLTKQ